MNGERKFQNMLNWSELIKIPAWTPLPEIPFQTTQVKDLLFRVGPGCYLTAVNNDANCVVSPVRLVTKVIWAETEGAAKRAVLSEIEADKLNLEQQIPFEMLLSEGANTYSEIVKILRSGKYGKMVEMAIYRIAKDGAFVHRQVWGGQFEFSFRDRKEEESERPYVIKRRLPQFK